MLTAARTFCILLNISTFIQEAIKYLGGIDLLVLNAGVGCVYELSQVKNLDDHKKLMNVNFWGNIYF